MYKYVYLYLGRQYIVTVKKHIQLIKKILYQKIPKISLKNYQN